MPARTSESAAPRALVPARRGFLLVVLAALCWGTSGISGAIVGRRTDLAALDIAWHRLTIGAAVLLAVHLLARRRRGAGAAPIPRGTAVRLVLCGIAMAVYQLAYFAAVAAAGVSIATLVALGTAPLLIAVGAALLGHGRPDRATVLVLAVALTGLVLLVGVSAGSDTGAAVVVGAGIALASAVAYAVITLAGGGVPPGVPVTLASFAGGAALLTPVVLALGLRLTGDPIALAVLLYLGAVPSALAYGLFFTGLRTVPGAVAGIVTLLEPLTATALATAFLGERLAPPALAGGLLVLAAVAGLYLRRLRQGPAPAVPAPTAGA